MLGTWFNNITVSFYWTLNISYILSWINDHATPLGWRVVVSITIALLYKRSHPEVKTTAQGRQLGNGRPSPSGSMSYCSHCCHKALDKGSLKRGGLPLAHSSVSWWGSHCGSPRHKREAGAQDPAQARAAPTVRMAPKVSLRNAQSLFPRWF